VASCSKDVENLDGNDEHEADNEQAEENHVPPMSATAATHNDELEIDEEQAASVLQEGNAARQCAVAAEEEETKDTNAATSSIMEADDNDDDQAPLGEHMIEDEAEDVNHIQAMQAMQAKIDALQAERDKLALQVASKGQAFSQAPPSKALSQAPNQVPKQKAPNQASNQPLNKKVPNKATAQVSKQSNSK